MQKKRWMKEEELKLRNYWGKEPIEYISALLSRSEPSLRQKALRLGLTDKRRLHKSFAWGLLRNNPYRQLSDVALAYIAGMLDGEGTIVSNKGSRFWAIQISNTHKGVIDWLSKHILYSRIVPVRHLRERRRPIWRCDLAGNTKTMALLEVLLPYLIVKKERALMLIAEVREMYQLGNL